jgi:hypothetical protein
MGGPSTYKLQEMRERGEIEDQPRRRHREPPGPPPTLGQLYGRQPDWLRVICLNPECGHEGAVRIETIVARLGLDASIARFWRSARCTRCGHHGARTVMPSWDGADTGWMPFPE